MYYNFADDFKLQRNMNEREIRIPMTRLKDYLSDTGITVTCLSELSGINLQHLGKCLSGKIDESNGRIRTMSDNNMARLQEALHQLALKLKYIFILYNTDMEVVKQNGRRYCPDCVDQIKTQLSSYINIRPFVQHSLGWNRSKARNVIDNKKSIAYGNISQDDVNRINIFLAGMATRLDMLTLTRG